MRRFSNSDRAPALDAVAAAPLQFGMARFTSIMRLRPEYPPFIRKGVLAHRGDVVTFAPNIRNDFFSTDARGFRHSTFGGDSLSVTDILGRDRYGIVLGSSHIFGLGIGGNENTIASLLGERFGIPFANLSLPEGNSRNLYALLFASQVRAPRAPEIVVHFSGGDFSSYCYTSMADSVFGSPNLKQVPMVREERGNFPNPDRFIRRLLAFSSLWTQSISQVCRRRKIPLILGHDTTFFEKSGAPSEIEKKCGLGTPFDDMQRRWFAAHKPNFPKFLAQREALAKQLGTPLAGPGPVNDYGFIDEFHYDRESTAAFFEDIAAAAEPLLSAMPALR